MYLTQLLLAVARIGLVVFFFCAECLAQLVVAAPAAGIPLLGFATGPAGSELIPITGRIRSANLDVSIPLPNGASRAYLPPLQQYAFLERADSGLSVWDFANGEHPLPIPDFRPSWLVFSTSGTAAAVMSDAGQLSIIGGLPKHPEMRWQTAWDPRTTVLAVSDDGLLVVAIGAEGDTRVTGELASELIARKVRAAAFAPRSHDLAISDAQANQIEFLRAGEETTLAEQFSAEALAFTKNGETLVALASNAMEICAIFMKNFRMSRLSLTVPFAAMNELRSGQAFLLQSDAPLPLGLLALSESDSSPRLTLLSR